VGNSRSNNRGQNAQCCKTSCFQNNIVGTLGIDRAVDASLKVKSAAYLSQILFARFDHGFRDSGRVVSSASCLDLRLSNLICRHSAILHFVGGIKTCGSNIGSFSGLTS